MPHVSLPRWRRTSAEATGSTPNSLGETFSYWADQWLATTYHLKPKTQEGYRSVLNHHLLPRLANTPVARIDLPMVTSLLSEFSRNGAGAGTVGNIRGALGLVLEQARRSGAIRKVDDFVGLLNRQVLYRV